SAARASRSSAWSPLSAKAMDSATRYWSVASTRRRLRSPVRYSPADGSRSTDVGPAWPTVNRRTASVRIRSIRSIPAAHRQGSPGGREHAAEAADDDDLAGRDDAPAGRSEPGGEETRTDHQEDEGSLHGSRAAFSMEGVRPASAASRAWPAFGPFAAAEAGPW